ncbi:autotransporter outer membrane beta-barrel domain-containing protein [Candidatus Pelagibacter sp.]|nr:autotransporter outer membrane beta-barrel domain-containing protein [Candidatus Pelagibacter sp.]
MKYDTTIKKKIQTAVTLALISSGIIPAVKAEVADQNVDNSSGTTIDQGSGKVAVDLDNGSTFTVTNAGTISASAGLDDVFAINVDSSNTTLSNLNNSGSITAATTNANKRRAYAVNVHTNAIIGTITNSGTIKGQGQKSDGTGIRYISGGPSTSITNTSTGIIEGISGLGLGGGLNGYSATGLHTSNSTSSNTITLDNDGIIRGLSDHYSGYGARLSSKITTIDNSGTILGQADASLGYGLSFTNSNSGVSITTINNSGTISGVAGTNSAYGIDTFVRDTGTINNSGTISAVATTETSYGLRVYSIFGGADITNLNNSGTISASSGTTSSYGVYLNNYYDEAEIVNFTNTGTISSSVGSGSDAFDIFLDTGMGMGGENTITNLNNSQGKSGNDVLTYKGKLPENYNVIVNSTSDYGQISFDSATGTTNFGVYNTSTLSGGTTYASVIQGIATAKIGATRTGTLGSYSWTLQLQDGETTVWDLVVESNRTGYTSRITSNKRSSIAAVLEAINTAGQNSALTSALDGLSDTSFNKALEQIEGLTIKSLNGNSFQKHSTFKRAVSSALSAPSVNSLTKNNYASLNLSDLSLSNDQNQYQVHSFNEFDFKSIARIYENKDLFSLKSEGSTFYIRTYADNLNQDKVDDSVGYESETIGLLFGNENNLTDEIKQGWSIGYSDNNGDFDDNYGDSESQTLHAMMYQDQQFDNFNINLNLGVFASRTDLDRRVTEGVEQTLESISYDYGFDFTAGINQSYELKDNYIFTPSFSTNLSYILQDDTDESGGSLALSVDNDNLLIVKPEIGFALDKKFKNTEDVTKTFGLSMYGSYEDKLDGTTSKAKIKSTSSNFNIVDDNTDDTFISTGLGYNSLDKTKNLEYNLGVYHTQNEDDDLNSTLVSYNIKKRF